MSSSPTVSSPPSCSFARWEDNFSWLNTHTKRLFKMVVVVAMISHWNGCTQFMLATQVPTPDVPCLVGGRLLVPLVKVERSSGFVSVAGGVH